MDSWNTKIAQRSAAGYMRAWLQSTPRIDGLSTPDTLVCFSGRATHDDAVCALCLFSRTLEASCGIGTAELVRQSWVLMWVAEPTWGRLSQLAYEELGFQALGYDKRDVPHVVHSPDGDYVPVDHYRKPAQLQPKRGTGYASESGTCGTRIRCPHKEYTWRSSKHDYGR